MECCLGDVRRFNYGNWVCEKIRLYFRPLIWQHFANIICLCIHGNCMNQFNCLKKCVDTIYSAHIKFASMNIFDCRLFVFFFHGLLYLLDSFNRNACLLPMEGILKNADGIVFIWDWILQGNPSFPKKKMLHFVYFCYCFENHASA